MDGKLRLSRQDFLVVVTKKNHLTLQMKSKYAKERSTAYKVGCLYRRNPVFPYRVQMQFFWQDRAGNNTASFSEFSKHFPELSVKYSKSVIESNQVNY